MITDYLAMIVAIFKLIEDVFFFFLWWRVNDTGLVWRLLRCAASSRLSRDVCNSAVTSPRASDGLQIHFKQWSAQSKHIIFLGSSTLLHHLFHSMPAASRELISFIFHFDKIIMEVSQMPFYIRTSYAVYKSGCGFDCCVFVFFYLFSFQFLKHDVFNMELMISRFSHFLRMNSRNL